MKNLQLSNGTFSQVVKKQKSAGGSDYRLLTYCLSQQVPEGMLLHNTLTRELVLLEGGEPDEMLSNSYLRENWFIVPQDFDDRKFVQQVRQMYRLLAPKPAARNSFTIFTTTDCNARCFYCYELGRSRIPMSVETAHKTAHYIYDNYIKLKEHDENARICLTWFGGEPLYNLSVIDIICSELRDRGVDYYSRMISNAYLFDDIAADKASGLWNLKLVQVTLDGTEEVYNRAKAFIYDDGSAFNRVIDNIDRLLSRGIKVSIRMNIDMHNADNLMELVDYLSQRFSGRKGFTCYSHPLYEIAGINARIRTDERRKLVYDKQMCLQEKISEAGLSSAPRLSRNITVSQCMADSGTSVTILPDGSIGVCEHYSDSDFISHIDSPESVDTEMVQSFRETCDDLDICHDCAFYPQCIRLKKCEEESYCFPELKDERLRKVRRAMLHVYERWKSHVEMCENDKDDAYSVENC